MTLATRGYLSPSTGSGGGGGGGPSGLVIPFSLYDVDSVLQPGIDLSGAGVVQVSVNGASFVNRVGSAPTSIGGGAYYYAPDTTEVATDGWILIKVVKTGYQTIILRENINTAPVTTTTIGALATTIANDITASQNAVTSALVNVSTDVWNVSRAAHTTAGTFGEGVVVNSLATAAINAVRDGILNYSHRSGRTVRGLLRRLDALAAGKATGLLGAVVKFFAPDGTTVEMQVSQTPAAGTRETATDVSGSETP